MRNLKNIRYSTWRSPPEHQERQISATAWDATSDCFICAYGPSENDTLVELVRVKKGAKSDEHTLITSWDAPSPNPDLACDRILSLHYFGDSLTACLVLAGGDIVVVREEPLEGEDRIEIVGSVDAGISAARWSPDEELLAITTKVDTLVFMSRRFEGIMDVAMTPDDLKASNHVSVGWGKKETQFHGKGAKALRDPTMPEKVDEGILSPHDGGEIAISWRGDGAFLALSTIESGIRRLIRVYSREGVLDSVSEPVDGLEGALSWRPAGNLMASVQRLADRIDIVFFERNGLRHGQFSLRLSPEEMDTVGKRISLSWNNDSSVLAVVLRGKVQLWTMGNYHWYLKQELITFDEDYVTASNLTWHLEKPLLLLVYNANVVTKAEYIFTIARGATAPPNDYGSVAVIDGKNLKVTPLRSANVPPPMALHELSVTENIIDVAFNSINSLIAVLHSGGIAVFSWKITPKPSDDPALNGRITFAKAAVTGSFQQVCFGEGGDILALCYRENGTTVVCRYGLNDGTGRLDEKPIVASGSFSSVALASFDQDGSPTAFLNGSPEDFKNITVSDGSLGSESFPVPLPWLEMLSYGSDRIAFGLSANGHLYANSRCLAKNCTSFLTTPAHLIFTTTTHLLKFVHITAVEDLEVPQDDPEKDERCRSIERGARLVTAMPTSLSLVLQMPRGNLETIWPRAMVLAGIRKLIDEKDYKKAFTHCRTQRVDMNILYDHQPEQFLTNVALFVDQVKKVSYIDLFLSSLREEDVTQTMYKETRVQVLENGIKKPNGPTPAVASAISKVNRVCDAVLEVMKTRTATNLQNIITANVCKLPPALDDGLLVVAGLMKENEAMAEKAVEHICFLADVNRLYENALGLYNLDLALLVAQQSQKDPREYLPFLQKLQEMSELRRHFSIDDHLGRHIKALSSLHQLSQDDHSELEAYTIKHTLYKHALTLYRYQPIRLNAIMALYAEHLESTSQFREAALAYESLSLFDSATTCYRRAGPSSWRESLFCASQQAPPLSGTALADLATALADSLYEAKDYLAAASIQTDYLTSIPTAARTLCKGYHFAAALHLASLHPLQAADLLVPGGIIDGGLTDALDNTTTLLSECKSQLLSQIPRIQELRLKALSDPLAFYGGSGDANEDIPDDISVAASSRLSTSASLFTRYTGRQSAGTAATGVSRQTSKNRRREERKRARGKKGSVYEEEYLIASVGRLVERVESVREEVGRLVVALVRRGMRERAQAVEGMLSEVVGMCGTAVREVFGEEEEKRKDVEVDEGGYRPIGGDAVFAESLEEVGKKKVAPHIGAFEKLSLLGSE